MHVTVKIRRRKYTEMTLHGENFSIFFEESAESVDVRLCAVTQLHKHSKCEQCFHTNSHTYILQIYAKNKNKSLIVSNMQSHSITRKAPSRRAFCLEKNKYASVSWSQQWRCNSKYPYYLQERTILGQHRQKAKKCISYCYANRIKRAVHSWYIHSSSCSITMRGAEMIVNHATAWIQSLTDSCKWFFFFFCSPPREAAMILTLHSWRLLFNVLKKKNKKK